MKKKSILQYVIEGIALSLLNLALIALLSRNYVGSFEIGHYGKVSVSTWYIIQIVFSLALAFITTKVKKIEMKKSKWIIGIYSIIPAIVYLCFSTYDFNYDYYINIENLKWIFILIVVAWFILRYEIDEIIK